jgi:hypothetical protein
MNLCQLTHLLVKYTSYSAGYEVQTDKITHNNRSFAHVRLDELTGGNIVFRRDTGLK